MLNENSPIGTPVSYRDIYGTLVDGTFGGRIGQRSTGGPAFEIIHLDGTVQFITNNFLF